MVMPALLEMRANANAREETASQRGRHGGERTLQPPKRK